MTATSASFNLHQRHQNERTKWRVLNQNLTATKKDFAKKKNKKDKKMRQAVRVAFAADLFPSKLPGNNMSYIFLKIKKNDVLSTGAESKSSNEERAFDSDEIVGRFFCEYLSPPCDDAATSASGEWKPGRGESTNHKPRVFCTTCPFSGVYTCHVPT